MSVATQLPSFESTTEETPRMERRWGHFALLPIGEGKSDFGLARNRFFRDPHGAVELSSAAVIEDHPYADRFSRFVLVRQLDVILGPSA